MSAAIDTVTGLSTAQQRLLAKAGITKLNDAWLHSATDVAKRLRVPVEEVQAALATLIKSTAPMPYKVVKKGDHVQSRICTTGDDALDRVLGGGIYPNTLTEIVGESAAGKTQFALQIALMAQLSFEDKGLEGGVAYFTSSSAIPTPRLRQIAENHPRTRRLNATQLMDNIHTCSTTTVPALMTGLTRLLPSLLQQAQAPSTRLKPIKMVVVDSLGAIMQSNSKTNTASLVERSRQLIEISSVLHDLASRHGIAVLVTNQVTDVFQQHSYDSRFPPSSQTSNPDGSLQLVYREQVRWFSRCETLYGESAKEAGLGLTWANQINTRIMLSRTRRRKRLDDDEGGPLHKRRKVLTEQSGMVREPMDRGPPYHDEDFETPADQGTLLRRLNVIFAIAGPPRSADFIIVKDGLRSFEVNGNFREQPVTTFSDQTIPSISLPPIHRKPLPQASLTQASQGFITAKSQLPAFATQQPSISHSHSQPTAVASQMPLIAIKKEASISSLDDYGFDEREWTQYTADLDEVWDAPDADVAETSAADISLQIDEEIEAEFDEELSADVEEALLAFEATQGDTSVS